MGEAAEPLWTPEERAAIVAEFRRQFPGQHIYPVQRGNLANQWENLADSARAKDADNPGPDKTRVPPTLATLVAAVMRTRLIRFYPFMALEHLHFADGPGVWDHEGEVAPAFIDRNRSEGYIVYQGSYHQRPPGQVTRTLTTHDPDEAAAEADRLLAGWAWSGQES
jgi:hypothetical protein